MIPFPFFPSARQSQGYDLFAAAVCNVKTDSDFIACIPESQFEFKIDRAPLHPFPFQHMCITLYDDFRRAVIQVGKRFHRRINESDLKKFPALPFFQVSIASVGGKRQSVWPVSFPCDSNVIVAEPP